MITNFPDMSLLHSCELVKFVVNNEAVHRLGTLASSATFSFHNIRGHSR